MSTNFAVCLLCSQATCPLISLLCLFACSHTTCPLISLLFVCFPTCRTPLSTLRSHHSANKHAVEPVRESTEPHLLTPTPRPVLGHHRQTQTPQPATSSPTRQQTPLPVLGHHCLFTDTPASTGRHRQTLTPRPVLGRHRQTHPGQSRSSPTDTDTPASPRSSPTDTDTPASPRSSPTDTDTPASPRSSLFVISQATCPLDFAVVCLFPGTMSTNFAVCSLFHQATCPLDTAVCYFPGYVSTNSAASYFPGYVSTNSTVVCYFPGYVSTNFVVCLFVISQATCRTPWARCGFPSLCQQACRRACPRVHRASPPDTDTPASPRSSPTDTDRHRHPGQS